MQGVVVHAAATAFPCAYQEVGTKFSASFVCDKNIEGLKQALLHTILELESTRISTKEEMRKNEETMRQTLHLLRITCQERDEIKIQFQALLEQLGKTNTVCLQPRSPTVGSKENSGISESESLSETHKNQSYDSSPGESFFNSVSSPDLSSVNWAESGNMGWLDHPFLENHRNPVLTGVVSNIRDHNHSSSNMSATQMVGGMGSGGKFINVKPLPEKGKLLQAVLEAGPLLQTLLIAGPLPRWRNPPPLQSIHVPAISIQEVSYPANPVRRQGVVPLFQDQAWYSGLNCNGDHQMSAHVACGPLMDSCSTIISSLKRSAPPSPDGTKYPLSAAKMRKII